MNLPTGRPKTTVTNRVENVNKSAQMKPKAVFILFFLIRGTSKKKNSVVLSVNDMANTLFKPKCGQLPGTRCCMGRAYSDKINSI